MAEFPWGAAAPGRPALVWVAVGPLLDGWTVANADPPMYAKDERGIVFLRGQVTGVVGANAIQAFQLPVGYRPGIQYHGTWNVRPNSCYIDLSTGLVFPGYPGSSDAADICDLSFVAFKATA